MSFPLKVSPGDRLFMVPGIFCSNNGSGRSAVVTEVGRIYVTVNGCDRYRLATGFSERGASWGRLWPSEAHYQLELARTTELVRLRRAIDRLMGDTSVPRPTIEQTRAAAAALGINLETAPCTPLS